MSRRGNVFLNFTGERFWGNPCYLYERELTFLFLADGEGRLTSFHQYVGEGETGVLAPLMELSIIAQF